MSYSVPALKDIHAPGEISSILVNKDVVAVIDFM